MSEAAWRARGVACVALVVAVLGAVIVILGGSWFAAPAPAPVHQSVVPESLLTFPRTATYVLDQHELPTVDELARYDLVVIDAEWQNRLPTSFFDELRQKNPRLRLLAYVNLVDSMPRTGSPEYWANAYSLWQFENSTHSNFPRQWLAYTADGTPVHEWQDRVMVNLTDVAPKVNGQIYAEYAANWVADHVWSTGLWDGIFLDVWGDRIYTADSDHWDIDGDGIDEPDSAIYGDGNPLDRGLKIAEDIMRERMPSALLVANGDRNLQDSILDGRVFEGFADRLADPDRDEAVEVSKYIESSTSPCLRQPSVGMTIDLRRGVAPNSQEDYRRARFFLTSTLMQDAWWAPMGRDYSEIAYYDEMDGAGAGRGYLGHPLEANPDLKRLTESSADGTGSPAPGVLRRDFEHGIAIVNMGDVTREIVLEREYRHLSGVQDPSVNDGREVDRVTIPPKDGVILLRTG